ncbi:MFS transporter [Arthrobacter sp.]|uniref:MFS transporter n=1 Tax=Arthrobacter sp. TaxID=1667 RepID=UPI0026DF8F95|nr:MFS transporter [Arthrobacter sp.]MDO5752587.1 MFS transporter [Arthrobacter sp.]
MAPLQRRVLWVAILASFVAFLDGAIVNVALPAIEDDLGGGLPTQQWVVDAYLLTLGALILLAGSLSDNFGRIRILRLGLAIFGIASLACAVAPTGGLLIAARAVQGAGAALLVPSSLALITSIFNGPGRAKAIGTWTAWTGTAFVAGPLLGGVLVEYISWRLVFAINVIPIAVTLVLLMGLGRTRPAAGAFDAGKGHPPVDVVGAVLAAVGLAGTVFALIEQQRLGWQNPAVFLPFVMGILLLTAFLLWEAKARHPMMPLVLFRARNFGVGNLATAFVYAGVSLGPLMVVIFLQEVAGFTAAQAGLATLPVAVLSMFLAGVFGGLSGRYGPRLFMAVGPVVAGIGFLLMMTAGEPFNFWLQMLPGMVLYGLGLAVTVAPLTSAILSAVPPLQSGIGSAVNNAVSRVAGLVAIALAGIIVGTALDIDSFRRIMAVVAVLLVIGGAISAVGITNKDAGGFIPDESAACCQDKTTPGAVAAGSGQSGFGQPRKGQYAAKFGAAGHRSGRHGPLQAH